MDFFSPGGQEVGKRSCSWVHNHNQAAHSTLQLLRGEGQGKQTSEEVCAASLPQSQHRDKAHIVLHLLTTAAGCTPSPAWLAPVQEDDTMPSVTPRWQRTLFALQLEPYRADSVLLYFPRFR